MSNTAVVCFRNDFRLQDNPALAEALKNGYDILPIYIYDEDLLNKIKLGSASKWWLQNSLIEISERFNEIGGNFYIYKGKTKEVIEQIIQKIKPKAIYWNRRYNANEIEVDKISANIIKNNNIDFKSFKASLIVEPWTTFNGQGNPFKVYTPFWKSVYERDIESPIEIKLENLKFIKESKPEYSLNSLRLIPNKLSWHKKFIKYWDVSEASARNTLENFCDDKVINYKVDRDRPDLEGTSSISPYLRWGQISPKQIVYKLNIKSNLNDKGPLHYFKEIYWREFAYYVLYHFPHTKDKPLQEKYKNFPWKNDASIFNSWTQGLTGYPIVDAGMRELYETGWMHNRVRMIVASFLVKHLLHDWKMGLDWFSDTLVDADLASNTLGWQWSGGCGADAAPYFRIFNPMIQGFKFDPNGDYVKKWVPEISNLDSAFIHEPWEAPDSVLSKANIVLGETYPKPIVDHQFGRSRALEALSMIK